MHGAPMPPNEQERVGALRRLNILDTPHEGAYDTLTKLAAHVFHVPYAAMILVDAEREWLKASVGSDVRESPRESGFCAYTILSGDTLVVPDALNDDRFRHIPQVVDRGIRFYAGSPIVTSDGRRIGSFCLKDTSPRDLSPADGEILNDLAQTAGRMIERRQPPEHPAPPPGTSDPTTRTAIATMCHDLRSHLTSILGFARILSDPATDAEGKSSAAEVVSRNAERMLEQVSTLQNSNRRVDRPEPAATAPDGSSPRLGDRIEPREPAPAAMRSWCGSELRGSRILLAEDAPENQRLLTLFLAKSAATVVTVSDGHEAVNALRESTRSGDPFDLVLMDLQMPGMDGFGAAREMRRLGLSSPIIALTAFDACDELDRCLAAGCDACLSKPISRTSLVEACQS